eukprot:scaffold1007_cov176-Amphora_coffeaeformis.AAC.14
MEDSYPMVVTPAPSTPESLVATGSNKNNHHPDLDRLWQGHVSSRRIHASEEAQLLTNNYHGLNQNTTTTTCAIPCWDQASSASQMVRVCGMIQDIGDMEFLPVDNTNTNFIERQPIKVVTNYTATHWPETADGPQGGDDVGHPRREKRARREESLDCRPTTLLLYIYYPHEAADVVRSELCLHQLVEWIVIKEEDVAEGDMMVDMTALKASSSSWSDDSYAMSTMMCGQDWKLPRLHVLGYCLRTMDDVHLTKLSSMSNNDLATTTTTAPLMETSEAIIFLTEALHVSYSIASALWLTLLSRAEPHHATSSHNMMLGCASLQFILPQALVNRWVQCLTDLLEPAVPLLQTWDTSNLAQIPRFKQQNGAIRRHPWQLPAGSTIVVQHGTQPHTQSWAVATLPSLVQHHQLPLQCEGCQQVTLPADWRFLVVSTPQTRIDVACTTTIDLHSWTPGYTRPCPTAHARWARTLASRRATVATVALPALIREQAPADFCRLRSEARIQGHTLPDEAAFGRWLTFTRLLARSRSDATANAADWEHALQLDSSLSLSF